MSKQSKIKNYSLSKTLREESKSNEEFEIMLSNLTLEELIGLKLEVSGRAVKHKLYGLRIYDRIGKICRNGIFKYAISAAQSKKEASMFLGMTMKQLNYYIRREKLFEDEQN